MKSNFSWASSLSMQLFKFFKSVSNFASYDSKFIKWWYKVDLIFSIANLISKKSIIFFYCKFWIMFHFLMSQKTYFEFYQTLEDDYYEIGDYIKMFNSFFTCNLNISEILEYSGTLDYFYLHYVPNTIWCH